MRLPNKPTEYLVAGVLAAIIVVSVLTLIYRPWSRPPTIPGAPTEFRLRCGKCGYEWSVDYEELVTQHKGVFAIDGPRLVDCPKCGRKKVAFKLVECPACHTFFTPDELAESHAEADKTGKLICPNPDCGIDMREWYVKRAKKAARR